MLNKIFSTHNIIKVSPDDNFSKVVSLLSTSHDAAFVIDDNEKLLGVINPYYCIIKKSYPANTKAKNCMFHPPHIDISMPIPQVIRLMLETKVHYLPVFEKNKLSGIISARQILDAIADAPQMQIMVSEILKNKKPLISVFEDDYILRAMNLFKKYRVSKLVVVSVDLKLKGILAYYDLISYLAKPMERQSQMAMLGNKVPKLERTRVRNFMKTQVLTIYGNESASKAIKMIIEHGIGSVVVIDRELNPLGVITTTDLLSLYLPKKTNFSFQFIGQGLSASSKVVVSGFINPINHLIRKQSNVTAARLTVREKKKGGVFEAILSLIPKIGLQKVIHEEGKNLPKVLNVVKKKAKATTKRNK